MPLPYTRPEEVVTDLIEDALGSLVVGTNLFRGPPKPAIKDGPIPRNAVFVYGMLSFQPEPYFGTQRKKYREFRVTIYVRQTQDQFETGQTLAREIWESLQQQDVTSYMDYIGILMAESDVTYFGLDDTDNHRWTMTARLMFAG